MGVDCGGVIVKPLLCACVESSGEKKMVKIIGHQVLVLAVIVILSPNLASCVSYHLTHERAFNNLYFTCHVQNGSSSVQEDNLTFWINETDKTYILNLSTRASVKFNVIAFYLRPQYEGTFYCGEVEGQSSNGLGPFAGKSYLCFQCAVIEFSYSAVSIREVNKRSQIPVASKLMLGASKLASYHIMQIIPIANFAVIINCCS